MSLAAHRQGDSRACGAGTVVTGQSTVFCGGKLASVNGDPDDHGAGALIAQCKNIYINGKLRVVVSNQAAPDSLCIPLGGAHCAPSATSGSPNVFLGES